MSSTKYTYQLLDPSVDCIRLLKVETSQHLDAPIHCSLVPTEFSQNPQYKALSYTWGDQSIKETIYVDGKEFKVGRNLYEALRYLREYNDAFPLWADAVCINQNDIVERNRQIRIMPHIYTRAETVLVWLNTRLTSQIRDPLRYGTEYDEISPMELCDNPYWERVWIIQEIGKARKIQVCFGQKRLWWNDFIQHIRGSSRQPSFRHEEHETSGPLRLDQQLRLKYNDGHNFASLLLHHKDAKCKDPRDKVYGFVGLAIDSSGFPMDYSKSVYEVWEDTINFVISHSLVSQTDMIKFCKLVKQLLACEEIEVTQDLAPKPSFFSLLFSAPKEKKANVIIPATIAGTIIHLGPSPDRLVADLNATDTWAAKIYQSFDQDRGPATEENEKFLRRLPEMNEFDLTVVVPFDMNVRWDTREGLWSASYGNFSQEAKDRGLVSLNTRVPVNSSSKGIAGANRKVFLYKHREYPSSAGRIGIGPVEMQLGDLVCCVRNLDKAVIVRMTRKERWARRGPLYDYQAFGEAIHDFEIVGTAFLSAGFRNPENYNKIVDLFLSDSLDLMLDARAAFSLVK